MKATNYKIRVLGQMLKNGDARINGKTCDGDRWPQGNHYWIIDDLINQCTYHVRVIDRPSWERYAPKE